jgi:hypothetical protein
MGVSIGLHFIQEDSVTSVIYGAGILYETEEFPITVFVTITLLVAPLYVHCTGYGANVKAKKKKLKNEEIL